MSRRGPQLRLGRLRPRLTVTLALVAAGIDAYDASDDYTPAEKAAVWFAEQMAVDHHSIGDGEVAALREHFDDAAILELMMMAGQYIGFGRVLAILQLETVACPLPAASSGPAA